MQTGSLSPFLSFKNPAAARSNAPVQTDTLYCTSRALCMKQIRYHISQLSIRHTTRNNIRSYPGKSGQTWLSYIDDLVKSGTNLVIYPYRKGKYSQGREAARMKRNGIMIAVTGILFLGALTLLGGWGKYILILLTLFLMLYSALLIHELGHFVVGRWLGYSFRFLIIGPVHFTKEKGKLTIALNTNSSNWGQCAMQVKFSDYETDRHRLVWYLAGGSLANLVIVLVGCILYAITGSMLWLLLVLFHFAFGLVAIVPLKAEGGAYSDGLGIRLLRRNGRSGRLFYALFKLSYKYAFAADKEELDGLPQGNVIELEEELHSEAWLQCNDRYELDMIMNLLYFVAAWQTMNERFHRTVQLLRPWIEQDRLTGAMKEELLLSYSFAKLATGGDIGTVPEKITVRHPAMLNILTTKIKALRYCRKGNVEQAIAVLQHAKNDILANKPYLLGKAADAAVLDKYIQVVRNYAASR